MSIQKNDTPQDDSLPLSYHRRHWMRQRKLTNGKLAKRFGLGSDMSVSKMMNKGLALQKYINILRDEYNMPDNLLPKPSRGKTGPLSKAERAAQVSALA